MQFPKVLVLFILMVFGFASSFAQTTWELVYENDGEGKAISGDLDALKLAIQKGASIRIGWLHQRPTDPMRKVEHMADAQFITIMSDSTVFAQITPIIGQNPDFDQQSMTFRPTFEWTFLASTTGLHDVLTRDIFEQKIIGQRKRRWGIKWFVKY